MSPHLNLTATPIDGLAIVEHPPVGDARGELERLYCADELVSVLAGRRIVQVNRTFTVQVGAVRGMHYQSSPFAETKLVTCLRGRVLDVAVDIRAASPTFLESYGVELYPGSHQTFLIPEGFAHGYQVLEEGTELLYLHTAFYSPEHECGLSPTDPALAIAWPLPIAQLSDRDGGHPPVGDTFIGVVT